MMTTKLPPIFAFANRSALNTILQMPPRLFAPALSLLALCLQAQEVRAANAPIAPGDVVRLTRGETLVLDGKNLAGAPKGQEFTLLQLDATKKNAAVEYYKKDGSRVAPVVPAEALEPAPADGWRDLWYGVEAFRDGRYAASRALVTRATQDAKYKPLASAIAIRLNMVPVTGAPAGRPAPFVPALRDLAAALCKNGSYSLGNAVDRGADRLAAASPGSAPSKLEAEDKKRGETATLSATLARQAYAAHKTKEASGLVKAGLEAEPTRPDLLVLQTKTTKDLAEAEDRMNDADRMRKIPKGEVHAITALQMGLKLAVDHPGLISLKQDMLSALESKTSPQVTPALLSAAKSSAPLATLEEGRKLYTTRCAECHDLEMLENRSVSSWERMVGGMSGRAHLNGEQQSKIMQYLTVALNGMQQ